MTLLKAIELGDGFVILAGCKIELIDRSAADAGLPSKWIT